MALRFRRPMPAVAALLFTLALAPGFAAVAEAQVTPFTRSLSEAASRDEAIAAFYRDRGYRPLWTGAEDSARREALLSALSRAADHGLPVQRYDAAALIAGFRAAATEGDRGRLEVAMTRALVSYAHDLQSGVLEPGKVDPGIKREVEKQDPLLNLAAFERDPAGFLKSLPPKDPEYARLVKEKIRLERLMLSGGWGPEVPATKLEPGAGGPALVALRDRLMAMGYLDRSATSVYDERIRAAVAAFQLDHGLEADGVAGQGTLAEINIPPQERLKSVLVAMERERWMGRDLGRRHIWVNLTDFRTRIVDEGKVTFETRSVIGKDVPDMRSPEFSDQMDYMVINPSWNVPRSITTKEYLPLMQRNPNAASHLVLVDRNGRAVNRGAVNFNAYNARNFPFSMRQPPSDGNALGLVKFMFPNQWNIYLHDTPSKSLFDREARAFSHGCIRLADPFDFAYALLAAQTDDPEGLFQGHLRSGKETVVRLDQPVPVHLVYFTAYSSAKGKMNYRRDVYGRDGVIYEALTAAGVVLGPLQG
ncbi:murein L,D-transpeptidase [Cereibacter changlensis JA139]|uniref:Murein L,D-transpeptidase n=3 Tax=Cereibacter changlensis TaxID=402884 RepID=A0A2T4JWT7_9RHOB|nr:murein L,D-transpeptidase [Cereibacter changlensis JA139]PZX57410.1 murein L,D-transpeptidase YcbB/YkuD [Cereibacter changlensis]